MNAAEFRRWRDAYEAAGIDPHDAPRPELRAAAEESGAVVASVAPRAVESAHLLDAGREVPASPLLRELDLHPPQLGRLRLPLLLWALAYGVRGAHFSADEEQRARAAADWLTELAGKHGSVMAVTHASFRSLLRRELVRRGWIGVPRGRTRHWSAWSFTRL
jgi:hypothetical protein